MMYNLYGVFYRITSVLLIISSPPLPNLLMIFCRSSLCYFLSESETDNLEESPKIGDVGSSDSKRAVDYDVEKS